MIDMWPDAEEPESEPEAKLGGKGAESEADDRSAADTQSENLFTTPKFGEALRGMSVLSPDDFVTRSDGMVVLRGEENEPTPPPEPPTEPPPEQTPFTTPDVVKIERDPKPPRPPDDRD